MDVSIVVCTYNRAASLRLTLDALDAQVIPRGLEWELLVIDNNSTDATRSVVDAFTAATRIRVRPLFVARQGLSHARNEGLAHSRGGIVAFTDDDVHPPPGWVAGIAAAMGEAGADILGGRILPAWGQPPPHWLKNRASLRGPLAIMEHETPALIVKPNAMPTVWGANMAFRREVFDKVGLFDTRRGVVGTKLYRGEEIDLVGRALAVGYRAVYDPRVVVWHRIGADRMRVGYFSRLYFQRAEGNALVKGPPPGRVLLGVPLYGYRSTASGVWRLFGAAVRRRPDTLDRWLACCEAVGRVWGFWKRYFGAPRAAH